MEVIWVMPTFPFSQDPVLTFAGFGADSLSPRPPPLPLRSSDAHLISTPSSEALRYG